jgi:SAM-dependent methyltransferase
LTGEQTHPSGPTEPSPFVVRFTPLVPRAGPSAGTVLDLACGAGRHARFFLGQGFKVIAVDRDTSRIRDLAANPKAEILAADLEAGPWPLEGRVFAGVVVTNYLFRPILPLLLEALEPGGVLLYETFARGNERLGHPRRSGFLLESGELLELARGRLQVVAYEHGRVEEPRPAVVQRLCAVNDLRLAGPEGPPPHPLFS